MNLEKSKNNKFYFRVRKGSPEEKKVWLVTKKDDVKKFKELGRTSGDIGISLSMATKYTENFLDRIYAFTVDDETLYELCENEELLDDLSLELAVGAKIIFYEKTENSPIYEE